MTAVAIGLPILLIAGALFALIFVMPRTIQRLKRQEAAYRANPEAHPHGWALVKRELRLLPVAVVVVIIGVISHAWGAVIIFGLAAVVAISFDVYRSERRHRQAGQ